MASEDLPGAGSAGGYTYQQYFTLVELGLLNEDDRVELLAFPGTSVAVDDLLPELASD
jgi:hypothetical protein